MGYTTEFEGQFTITPPLDPMLCAWVRSLHEPGDRHPDDAAESPGGYCQWEPTRDGSGLKWDGEEKFYEWENWLEFIVARLGRHGRIVSGSVRWQGEVKSDRGTLSVVDGKAHRAVDDVKSCPHCGEIIEE